MLHADISTPLLVKEVHKAHNLDLVGWFTVLPLTGPLSVHIPIQQQLSEWCELPLFLGFHPAAVLDKTVGGKLPLTLYEPVEQQWREIPYTVETGEAEMISVDFVARGGGNATAVEEEASQKPELKAIPSRPSASGNRAVRAVKLEAPKKPDGPVLSGEEEALIASLTAKANAIKMLSSRISLIQTYLQDLPPTYISEGEIPQETSSDDSPHAPIDHSILRSISALLIRLALLIPADSAAFERELTSEQNDVSIVSMLSIMTESIKDARLTGRRLATARQGKIKVKKATANRRPDRVAHLAPSWLPKPKSGGGILSGVGDLAGVKMARE